MVAFQEDAPAVARQRVRRALRQARQATPLSQGDVAKKLGWSLSKMQRIEAGEVGVSLTDLRALLDVYGISDEAEVARLTVDARTSRRQRWWTAPEYRQHLTPALRQLIQFETGATAITAYQPNYFPGILQTPAVAQSILDSWSLSDEDRQVRFDVRMMRGKSLIERADGPDYRLVLDESVIKRRIGGSKITAEQLEFVAQAGQRPHIHIRVVPFAKAAYIGALAPFQILDLSHDVDDAVLYREPYKRDEIIHDVAEIAFHRDAFENLWKASLNEQATLRAMVAEAAQLRSSLDYEASESIDRSWAHGQPAED
jgi:transcriptional regulator with XRE-family HTH domain